MTPKNESRPRWARLSLVGTLPGWRNPLPGEQSVATLTVISTTSTQDHSQQIPLIEFSQFHDFENGCLPEINVITARRQDCYSSGLAESRDRLTPGAGAWLVPSYRSPPSSSNPLVWQQGAVLICGSDKSPTLLKCFLGPGLIRTLPCFSRQKK